MYFTAHHPYNAEYLGRDGAGPNYLFRIESSSEPGRYYSVLVFADGSGVLCECIAATEKGGCTMTAMGPELIQIAEDNELGQRARAKALEMGDPGYVFTESEQQLVRELESAVDERLSQLSAGQTAPYWGLPQLD